MSFAFIVEKIPDSPFILYPTRATRRKMRFLISGLGRVWGLSHGQIVKIPTGGFGIVVGELGCKLWFEIIGDLGASFWNELREASDLLRYGFSIATEDDLTFQRLQRSLLSYNDSLFFHSQSHDVQISLGPSCHLSCHRFVLLQSPFFFTLWFPSSGQAWSSSASNSIDLSHSFGPSFLPALTILIHSLYAFPHLLKFLKKFFSPQLFVRIIILADFLLLQDFVRVLVRHLDRATDLQDKVANEKAQLEKEGIHLPSCLSNFFFF